jgi:dephospho-CoA kinase
MTKRVGITGGIGSGKSTVCNIFASMGVAVYNADEEAKRLYDTDAELKQWIIENFGKEIYANGKFNKVALRDIVFKDDEKLTMLNTMVHPRVQAHAAAWLMRQHGTYAIKEAALMVESGSYKQLDALIVVTCPIQTRLQRVISRDGLSEQEVVDRISHQMPEDELLKFANFTICNDGLAPLIPQVLEVHRALLNVEEIG